MSGPRIVVAGGGMVGATVASLLAKTGMEVHLVDSRGSVSWDAKDPVGLRVSALSPGSEAILDAAGAWAMVRAGRHCVYRRMHVEDGQGRGSIDFEAARFGLSHLGTLVENDLVSAGLWEACAADARLESHTPDRVVALVDMSLVETESGRDAPSMGSSDETPSAAARAAETIDRDAG